MKIILIILLTINIFASIDKTSIKENREKKVFKEAFELLKTSKFKEAFKKLLILAKEGSSKAMLSVANLYFNGKGVRKDYVKALKWYEKADSLGNTKAKYPLANMYKDGLGVKVTYYKAFDLYLQSAITTNNKKAMFFVAAMYYHGEGIRRDYKKAYKWAMKSLEQKEARSAFLLGLLYLNGQGVKKDLEQAFYYANMAKSLGNKEAPKLIELIEKENIEKK